MSCDTASLRTPSSKIDVINGLRGYAILAVILFHSRSPVFPDFLNNIAVIGWSGVNLFFILSGFVLFLPYASGIRTISSTIAVFSFFKKRSQRIFPLFFVSVFLVFALRSFPYTKEIGLDFIASLFLVHTFYFPTFFPNFNRPLWSIGVEWWFSIIFPLFVIYWRKRNFYSHVIFPIFLVDFIFRLIVASTLKASYVAALHFSDFNSAISNILPARLDDFLTGMLICNAYVRSSYPSWIRRYTFFSFTVGLFFIFFAFAEWFLAWNQFIPFFITAFFGSIFQIGTSVLLLSLLSMPENFVRRLFSNGPIQLVGLACYSIYVWHEPIRQAVLGNMNGPIAFPAAILLIMTVSFLSYRFIEFPNAPISKLLPESLLSAFLIVANLPSRIMSYLLSLKNAFSLKKFAFYRKILGVSSSWTSSVLNLRGTVFCLGSGYGVIEKILAKNNPNAFLYFSDTNAQRINASKQHCYNVPNLYFETRDYTLAPPAANISSVLCIDVIHHLPEEQQLATLEKLWHLIPAGGSIYIKDLDTKPYLFERWAYFHDLIVAGLPITYRPISFYQEFFQSKNATISIQKPPRSFLPYNHFLLIAQKP